MTKIAKHLAILTTFSSSAVDILKESFARGEIDEEEYRLRKKLLDES